MRKRVLLVHTWTNNNDVLGYYLSPPMGLYRIRNWLKDKHMVDVLDPNVDDPVEFMQKAGPYDVYGFSPTSENMHNDIALMRFARKLTPSASIVLGGVQATCNYQSILDMNICDCIIFGEGEKALEFYLEGTHARSVTPSMIAKDYNPRTVLTADDIARASDMDFRELHHKVYWERNKVVNPDPEIYQCVNLYLTNYCPQGCKFCSTTNFIRQACSPGASVVTHPAKKLINLLHKVKEQIPETRTIYFHDDNACHDREVTIEWCKIAIKDRAKLDVSFVATSRMKDFDEEMLRIMKDAGFRKISCGVEAYSDGLLKRLRKGQTTRDIENFLAMMRRVGMAVHMNLMLCQPEAEIEDVVEVAKFGLRILDMDELNTVTVEPHIKAYPGSWYFDNWDRIEYSYADIPSIKGTRPGRIRVPERFIPRDPKVRRLLEDIDQAMQTRESFIELHKGSFLASQRTRMLCDLVLELVPGSHSMPSSPSLLEEASSYRPANATEPPWCRVSA